MPAPIARFLAALITGLIITIILSLLLVLPVMGVLWLILGPPPASAWLWVYGVLASATLANALRYALTPPRSGDVTSLPQRGGTGGGVPPVRNHHQTPLTQTSSPLPPAQDTTLNPPGQTHSPG